MLSRSTAEIIQRLDSGQRLGDRLAFVGLVLAGTTFVSTPFAMITGYYGMNVQELVDGGVTTLFEFWQAVLPVLAAVATVTVVVALRLVREHKRQARQVWGDAGCKIGGIHLYQQRSAN